MFIERSRYMRHVQDSFRVHPATVLLGPRQCGKTTLAGMLAEQAGAYTLFDLEKAVDKRRLEQPEQALGPLRDLVIIDEVQRQPALFETLRVLLDRPGPAARFLLLGSASPAIIKGLSETLAGRVGMVDLAGFDISELQQHNWQRLWLRGGFPRSYLAKTERAAALWRENFIRTFLERDIPQFGIRIAAESLRRFWTMIAHYHGQVWNAAEFARALGTSEGTARAWLDILSGAYMLRVLPPWHANLKKRQVKAPKIYVRDSGLLHGLLALDAWPALSGHPKRGASFEGFVIEQILAHLNARTASFWATHAGAEIDLIVVSGGKKYGFECKYSDAPGATRSMHTALADLQLAHIWVVYPGHETYQLDERLSAIPVDDIPDICAKLKQDQD